MNRKHRSLFACAVLASTLVGCGGGGDDSPAPAPAPAPPPPALAAPSGLYGGTTSTNWELNFIALENGSVWGLYGRTQNNIFGVYGLVQGNGAANNGSFAATDGRDYFYDGTTYTGVVSASYTAAGAFNGSVTSGTAALTFATNKATISGWSYDTPAQLADTAGNWTGTALDGSATTVTVNSAGAFAGTSSGCSFSGTIGPRASGKNVFDVNLTFGTTPCATPGGAASGIALIYPIAGSSTLRQLLVAVQNPTRTRGTVLFAVR